VRRYTIEIDGIPFTIDVEETAADQFTVMVGDQVFEATLESDEDLPGAVIRPGMSVPEDPGAGAPSPGTTIAAVPRAATRPRTPAASATPARPPRSHPRTPGVPGVVGGRGDVLVAPMPGVILEVHAKTGDTLRRGDLVLVLEAMKMRNAIRAPHPGVVTAVEVEVGQLVGPGDPLVRLGTAT
jgi:biotin carboxyl carrier protein